MSWTQPCCEACFVRRHIAVEGDVLSIRLPTRLVDPGVEQCCYCGAVTIVGIFVRQDPTKVAFPREESSVGGGS